MTDDPNDRDAHRRLHQIARILGVPPASFFVPEHTVPGDGLPPALRDAREAQALVLMHLFLKLHDPAARDRCLDYVRGEAAHSG